MVLGQSTLLPEVRRTRREWPSGTLGRRDQQSPDMINRGWTKYSFKAGDLVTVTLEPVKNGAPNGRVLQVVLPDGKTLGTGGGGTPAPGR